MVQVVGCSVSSQKTSLDSVDESPLAVKHFQANKSQEQNCQRDAKNGVQYAQTFAETCLGCHITIAYSR